ncbi:MAG: T9SS C-terminal target domain-containing protein, partial [Salinibacter sp.]
TLEYISIRHGGFSITGVSGDEINGLTLGGIGRGTTINHIEIFANADDGIEWFGGTVHAHHLVSAFCGDDAFDWDTGFRGTGQFWFAVQATDDAGRGGELDGFDSTTDENTEEFSDPVVANATLIGSGSNSGVGSNSPTLRIRNGGASEWYNSIFTAYPNTALRIDADDSADQRWKAGDIVIRNNVFFDYGAGSSIPAVVEGTSRDSTIKADNVFMDPQLAGISRSRSGSLDPRPEASGLPTPEDKSSFENTSATPRDNYVGVDLGPIENTDYLGAFAPNGDLWTTGWTKLSTNGYMVQ